MRLDPDNVLVECLLDCGGDVEAAFSAAQTILSTDASGHEHKGKGIGGGQFTSDNGSSNRTEQVRGLVNNVFGVTGKVKFKTDESGKVYGEHGGDVATVVNPELGKGRPISINFKTAPGITETDHLICHELVHQAYSEDSELGAEIAKRLSKVNAANGSAVSIYGAFEGIFENVIELGAVYSHSPEQLKAYSAEMYDLAVEWSRRLTGGKGLSTDTQGHKHRGKGIGGGQFISGATPQDRDGEQRPEPPKSKLRRLWEAAKNLPAKIKEKAVAWTSSKYQGLTEKYGKKGAIAILVGMAVCLPIPAPGTMYLPLALASGIRNLVRLFKRKPELSAKLSAEGINLDELLTAAKELLHDLAGELGEQTPTLDRKQLAHVLQQLLNMPAGELEDLVAGSDVALSFDIHNRKAQGILNRSLQAVKGLSAAARKDFAAALSKGVDTGEAIVNFIHKYRLQLARVLTTTQLAALLEGAVEVANKVPTLSQFPGAIPPPPTLEPEEAISLAKRLEKLDPTEQAEEIYKLPVPQQAYIRQVISSRAAPPPVVPPIVRARASGGAPEDIHLVTIDEAVTNLAERNVMDRRRYDALEASARAKAFTVANVQSEETLTKIRDSLAENVKEGADYETWRKKVLEDVGQGTFMSDAHQETVFRTNVQTGFSDGQEMVLQHPLVRSGFPYRARDAIHDDRVREDHLALEHLGIQGTNIYRADDPVWQLFRVPWDYNDRCADTAMTVRQAAEKGIKEAQIWLETGVEPTEKAWVEMPDFRPREGFIRDYVAPLSIQLSMQSITSFGLDRKPEEETDTSLLYGESEGWGSTTGGALDTAHEGGRSGKGKRMKVSRARTARGKRVRRSLFKKLRVKKKWRPIDATLALGLPFSRPKGWYRSPTAPKPGWVNIYTTPTGGKWWASPKNAAAGVPGQATPSPATPTLALGEDEGVEVLTSSSDLEFGGIGEPTPPVMNAQVGGGSDNGKPEEKAPKRLGVVHDWDDLRSCVVGRSDNDVLPAWYPSFTDPDGNEVGGPETAGQTKTQYDPEMAERAMEQQDALAELLEKEGVQVIRPPLLPPDVAQADPVGLSQAWMREVFMAFGSKVVIGQMRTPHRNKDVRAIEWLLNAIKDNRLATVHQLPACSFDMNKDWAGDPRPFLEGGDVFRLGKDVLVTMSYLASSPAGYRWLANLLEPDDIEVWPAYLTEKWEHGDYVFMPVREGLCIAYLQGFADGLLPSPCTDWNVVALTLDETDKKFAANGIVLRENVVIMPKGAPRVVRALERKGVDVIEIPFDGPIFFQGGIDCSISELWRE